ncbi:hypothetical protein MYX77_02155 [Acidobacteriia bacterium AH_259_A11_L15]|nr:hypothetical protein [Acidobacteriia bacterium AH_259_A11_L15]
MLTQGLWWAGNLLILLLFVRALSGKFLSRYPVFYFYLGYVLLESVSSFYIYTFHPSFYESFYWYTQFLGVALEYCVIWEIYSQSLIDFPGVTRMARALLTVIFIAAMLKALMDTTTNPVWSPAEIPAVLERNLRTVQALLLVGIVGLLAYYAIPVGRNLKGMVLGYGVAISASVISLTLRSHFGKEFQLWWQYFHPMAYFLTYIVWCISLWSYQPNPRPRNEIALEHDYEVLAAGTARAIAQARSYLAKAFQS